MLQVGEGHSSLGRIGRSQARRIMCSAPGISREDYELDLLGIATRHDDKGGVGSPQSESYSTEGGPPIEKSENELAG